MERSDRQINQSDYEIKIKSTDRIKQMISSSKEQEEQVAQVLDLIKSLGD